MELYNITVSSQEEGGIKEKGKKTISDSVLQNILPPQLKNMST